MVPEEVTCNWPSGQLTNETSLPHQPSVFTCSQWVHFFHIKFYCTLINTTD
jgi:hypothetical protein